MLASLPLPFSSFDPSNCCSFHQDHWDCVTPCLTVTSTRLAIDATITGYDDWFSSMNSEYSTSGVSWSGSRVFVHTSVYDYPGGSFTGYGVYDSHALTKAGYNVITEQVTTTSCPPTSVTMSPSPTGSDCSPHGDHCEYPLDLYGDESDRFRAL